MSINASSNPFICSPAIIGGDINNYLIEVVDFIFEDSILTLPIGFKWKIGGNFYQNTEVFQSFITPTLPDLKRIDVVVANTNNTFEVIQGQPFDDIVVTPQVPSGKVFVMYINVFGDDVQIENPSLGADYVVKKYFGEVDIIGSGSNFLTDLDSEGKNTYNFTAAPTSFKGFNFELNYPHIFTGKIFFIKNNSGTSFNIVQNTTTSPNQVLFGFAYTIQPGELLMVRFSANGLLDFIATSLTLSLGQKQDKMSVVEISANTTISNSHHGKILLITGNATLTIPSTGLPDNFTCDIDVLSGFICNLSFTSPATVSGNSGLSLLGNKMATLYKRGNTNNYRLKGELS